MKNVTSVTSGAGIATGAGVTAGSAGGIWAGGGGGVVGGIDGSGVVGFDSEFCRGWAIGERIGGGQVGAGVNRAPESPVTGTLKDVMGGVGGGIPGDGDGGGVEDGLAVWDGERIGGIGNGSASVAVQNKARFIAGGTHRS